jgi:hypothetical protein
MPANFLKKWDKILMAKLILDIVKEIAYNKGGECLSKKYINKKTLMHWTSTIHSIDLLLVPL